ncbi:ROK family transcriptional regulator [Microbacterium sp. SORGH_AS_0421]|uniref:ROK family transcriptional regulator n=1 Tax=Microbacterium sp. SORGH_AS_0421 TaxID=3041768 RepID=UPI002790884D|nr:ROK family transcriptional regulator [Microbacterium sp. SORGH_AS_0421]MDQ1176516.1 putative NBD/HSP70 family sugar kinase [Microbacterium sp. SORGH_AS_0421]
MSSDQSAVSAFQQYVRARILEHLRQSGEASRTVLAEVTGLSRRALGGIVDDMKQAGLVDEADADRGPDRGVGRPARVLRLPVRQEVTLAADISPDRLRVALVDSAGAILSVAEANADIARGRSHTAGTLAALARSLDRDEGRHPARAVLGLPTMVDYERQLVDPAGARALMPSWTDGATVDEFSSALGLPVTIANGATLATLAELRLGAGRGRKNFIVLGIGHEGIGSGIVVEGRVFEGARGFAGEISHVSVHADGVICPCGQRGCLAAETANQLRLFLQARGVDMNAEAYEELSTASAQGDPAVRRLFADIGWQIGRAVGSVANVFDPDAVIINDTLTEVGDDAVTQSLVRSITQHTHPGITAGMTVVASDLKHTSILAGAGLL